MNECKANSGDNRAWTLLSRNNIRVSCSSHSANITTLVNLSAPTLHLTCSTIICSCPCSNFILLSLQARVYDNTIHSINITLVNVSRDDNNFLLTCTATNVVGMTNASVQLTVHCKYTHTHIYPDSKYIRMPTALLLAGCYISHLIVPAGKYLLVFSLC